MTIIAFTIEKRKTDIPFWNGMGGKMSAFTENPSSCYYGTIIES